MDKVIAIVSGLPRSGTSMMMKMLEAGGLEVVVDNIRKADEDNPRGYFEFEKVKKIKEDASWLEDARGKVFKMVSMLLYDLPTDREYKIVFMKRKMDEILASQKRMLERQGLPVDAVSDEEMARLFSKHLGEIEKWLGQQKNIEVLYVSYNDFIEKPLESIKAVNRLFENKLNVERMAEVVDKTLYRQRK